MVLHFEADNLIKRIKTDIVDDNNNLIYWSIYDFAYKYRTRIFSNSNDEIYYVEKDVTDNSVGLYDAKGNGLFNLVKNDDGYQIGNYLYQGNLFEGEIDKILRIDDGSLFIDDDNIPLGLLLLYGLVEINRED